MTYQVWWLIRTDGKREKKGDPRVAIKNAWSYRYSILRVPQTAKNSKLDDLSQGWPEGEGKDATPFSGLLHFTIDPYLTMPSVKARGHQVPFFWVFSMTRPGIEPRSSGPLANTLLISLIALNRYSLGEKGLWK